MKYRKLRIAWSVAWGVVALLLILVWVHGCGWCDMLFVRSGTGGIQFTSTLGRIICIVWDIVPQYAESGEWFTYAPEWIGDQPSSSWAPNEKAWEWGASRVYPNSLIFKAPIWSFTLLAALLTVLPLYGWRPRFSLRTLLIATTLVALLLGLFVWLNK